MIYRLFFFLLVLLSPATSFALTEVPCNGVDDDSSGGDQACAAPDADGDGYTTDGTGKGYDCDDSNKRIFPGVEVWTSGTSWKTCLNDGTYSSIGNSCPSGNCYFINPSSGSDSNAGTSAAAAFQHLTMVSYYASGAPSGNVHSSITCGDHIYLLPGTYNSGQGHNLSGTLLYNIVGLLLYNKSCASNPVTIHFIGAAIIDTIGTSSGGTDGTALAIDHSPGTIIKGNTAGEIKNIYSSGGGGIELGAIKFQESDDLDVSGLYIHDNSGDGNANAAAVYSGTSSHLNFHHNIVYDQINSTGNPANSCLFVAFHGTNMRLSYNSWGYTSGATAYCGMKWKHNDVAGSTCRFDHNKVSKAPGFISACASNTVDHNVFADGDCSNHNGCGADACAAVEVCDNGGTHLDGNQVVEYNTVYSTLTGDNQRLYNWVPVTPFAGTSKLRRNVYQDLPTSYSAQAGIENVAPYGSDSDFTSVITGGKYSTKNNCYYNSASTTTRWSFFGNNGSTSLGSNYDYSGLTGAGYCSGCQNGTNPSLDNKLQATAGLCKDVAGWNVGWLEDSPACVATASVEICGNGVDDTCSGKYGSCGAGYVDAKYGKNGCDKLCDSADHDQDGDGYTSTGSDGFYAGTDCDDTDITIYPGVSTTSGCSSGQWRTCQTNGTYTSCSSSDYCPSGCTTCRYIDAASGNNSNNGQTVATAWADYRNFTSYYTGGDEPAGYEAPVAGRCYLFLDGTYSYTYAFNTDTVGMFIKSVDGNSGQHIKFENYVGHNPILKVPGTSGAPRVPLVVEFASFIDVAGFSFMGNYCDGVREPNAFCIGVDSAADVTVSRMRGYNNQGVTSSNFSAMGASSASDRVNFHHNWLHNNYLPGGSGKDTQLMFFRGVGNVAYKNTLAMSVANEADLIRQKHANFDSTISVRGNSLSGGIFAVSLAGPNFEISNNRVIGATVKAFHMADNGGTSFQTGTMLIQNNTILSARLLEYNPQLGYNTDNTSAADQCSGNPTPGTLTVSNNVIVDNVATYPGESEMFTMMTYGPDSLRTAFLTSGKTIFNGNCYYNGVASDIVWAAYSSNNGDTSCSGRGSFGQSWSDFATWVAAGYETGSYEEDASLNGYNKATSTHCASRGWNFLPAVAPATGPGGRGRIR